MADRAATSPLVRWSWTGPSDVDLAIPLAEFRPTDRETVLEMMEGRYLLSSKLIDTHGASPFAVAAGHGDWRDDLHAFDWLRHFRDARSDEERGFARSLALDWIAREGRFDREIWAPALTARRVLNWLRHFKILVDAATPEETNILSRSLSTQVQSLKLRGILAPDPVDALLSAIALVGVAACDEKRHGELGGRLKRVMRLLDTQLDDQGLHRSRSARVQLMIMAELISLEMTLGRHHERHAHSFNDLLESMHRALDAISLGTGEPAYFNGTGQLPHDIIVAVQAQSPTRARSTGVVGGYGRLVEGPAIVVADSGLVPPSDFAGLAHASALAFEFSHGRELVVCNCGPAPGDFDGDDVPFRQGIMHSCPTINGISASAVAGIGPLAGRLVPVGAAAEVRADAEEQTLALLTHGYEDRFGVAIERRLTLMAEGNTLVGQDRFARARSGRIGGRCAIRFHLAHGTELFDGTDMLKLQLASGAVWNFMWEGADIRVEESVRQSAYFGFHRTQQIVLELPVMDGAEVSWIFTLDEA